MAKFLNKFYNFIDKIGKHNFILVVFIFIVLLITGLYQTFSFYTESEGLSIVDGIKTYKFILNNSNETNTVIIAANSSKSIDITVSNESEAKLLYGLYYSTTTTDLTYVNIGYKTNTTNLPNSIINSNDSYIVTIQIDNYTSEDITFNLGIKYGFTKGGDLTLDTNEYWLEEYVGMGLMKNLFRDEQDAQYWKDTTYMYKIVTASFVDYIDTDDAVSSEAVWDVSRNEDGSVISWLEETETAGTYDLYIGSNSTIYAESLAYTFSYLRTLTTINFDNLDTSLTNAVSGMFTYTDSLTTLDLSNWDVSKVTDVNYMFAYGSGLISFDASGWDLSSATTLSYMFSRCDLLTTVDFSNADVSNVTNMSGMFENCPSLASVNFNGWDTSGVTNMSKMFYNCKELTSLDLSGFDTSSVTNMSDMFYFCESLISLNANDWNTSKVTDMTEMFISCYNLIADLSKWNTSSLISISRMFDRCNSISTTFTIMNPNTAAESMGVEIRGSIVINYTSATESIVDTIVSLGEVSKGTLVS